MNLQRLNMDNSWRMKFAGLDLLIDPWLQGVEVDYFPWFNTQWHRTKPIPVQEIGEHDLVLITQKYPDHFHQETLLALAPEQLVVPKSIEKKVRRLLPNANVLTINSSPHSLLGSRLNIHFLPTNRKIDPIYDALLLENGEESILLATHGLTDLEAHLSFIRNAPPVKLVLTPFDHYRLPALLGGTVAPGMDAVRALIETIDPRYVVATHDEDKFAKGLVTKAARITKPPSPDELRKEALFENRLLTIDNYHSCEL